MLLSDKKYSIDSVVRLILITLFSIGGLWLLNYLSDVLIPFFIAFLLAYIINPMVLSIQKKVSHRGLAVFLTLSGIFLAISVLLVIIVPVLTIELQQATHLIAKFVNDSEMTKQAIEFLPQDLWETIKEPFKTKDFSAFIQNKQYLKGSQDILKKVLPEALGLMADTAQVFMGITVLFIIMLYLVFLLKDFKQSKEEWISLLPVNYREAILDFLKDADDAMSTYFRAQSHVAALVGILFAFGFWLIGLPLGLLLGLIVGALNMVPYLQLIAVVPAIFLAFIGALETGSNPIFMISLVFTVFIVVQVLQDAIIVPKIMGKGTGLSPAMILLSISIWGKLLGMLGLIIAIPASCLLLASYKRIQAKNSQ